MFFLVLLVYQVYAYNYDWERLHSCQTALELKKTVFDYKENFPCLDCKIHFKKLLDQHPFQLEHVHTENDVQIWSWFTHNMVNVRLNKSWESFDIMLQYQTCK